MKNKDTKYPLNDFIIAYVITRVRVLHPGIIKIFRKIISG